MQPPADRKPWRGCEGHSSGWCPTDLSGDGYKQCHADALLEFANEETTNA